LRHDAISHRFDSSILALSMAACCHAFVRHPAGGCLAGKLPRKNVQKVTCGAGTMWDTRPQRIVT
jgi:hypothetical protein